MRPQAVTLGPFLGGLNLVTDAQSIADDELVECINFEVDLDGSLINRPAIIETANNGDNSINRQDIIGRANFTAGGSYIITSNTSPESTTGGVYAFNGVSWSVITNTDLRSDIAVQYNNVLYIIARQDSTVDGGTWDGTTFTSVPSLPRGSSAVFHKSRLFIVPGPDATTNTSRLVFSDVITSTTITWPGANNIDISPGDGESLNDIIIYNDNLVLFKDNSIYLLAYDISPADAVLREINGDIGVSTLKSIDTYNNSVFFMHKGVVWEMQNYEFSRTNEKVPFVLDDTELYPTLLNYFPVWLRKVGDRILVGFYNKRYSYHLLTRTWSEWKVHNNYWAHLFAYPVSLLSEDSKNDPVKYYMSSCYSNKTTFYYMTDKYVANTQDYIILNNSSSESAPGPLPIICSAQTKELDFDVPYMWKRLLWWGIKAYTGTNINTRVIVNHITQSNNLWQDLTSYTWNGLVGTWDNILNQFTVVSDTQGSSTLGGKFYKFIRGLRFRTISFRIEIQNDGTTSGGPCRLHSLIATVGAKQVSSKAMN